LEFTPLLWEDAPVCILLEWLRGIVVNTINLLVSDFIQQVCDVAPFSDGRLVNDQLLEFSGQPKSNVGLHEFLQSQRLCLLGVFINNRS
jgi:hypothetical protein